MTDEERKARSALQHLDPGGMDYQEWLEIGMGLHNGGFPCSLWDEWSRSDSSRYHEGECASKWRSFSTGGNGKTVTMGTVYHKAELNGWTPAAGQRVFGWDDVISVDGDGWQDTGDPVEVEKPPDEWNPTKQARDYLTALFEPNDHVAYVVTAYQDEDGKWKPHGGICSRTRDQLLQALDRHPDDITDTFGDYNPNAGAWVCFNPVDGEGRNNKNVTGFRYALVESDTQATEEQLQMIREMRLPARIVVHSGGKSLHAIVRIDASDADEYRQRVEQLHQYCRRHGFEIDKQNKNPSRLSRLPGFDRNGQHQRIIARDLGCADWASWAAWTENREKIIAPFHRLKRAAEVEPIRMIVEGLLSEGLCTFGGGQKMGKTWLALDLALSVANGTPFLGHDVRQGDVLYISLEMGESAMAERGETLGQYSGDRLTMIYDENHVLPGHLVENIAFWMEQADDPVLVIVDTLKRAMNTAAAKGEDAYEKDTRLYAPLQQFATQRRISIVGLHHLRKARSGTDATEHLSGSNGLAAVSDVIWNLERDRGSDLAKLIVTARNFEGTDLNLEMNGGKWQTRTSSTASGYMTDPVIQGIRALMDQQSKWAGTASDLFSALARVAGQCEIPSPPVLGRAVTKWSRDLRDRDGISCRMSRTGTARMIILERMTAK